MSDKDVVELQADCVGYYSKDDESCFFEWLQKIPCVDGYYGKGTVLFISVDRSKVGEEELLELLALFYRYSVSMAQLKIFDCPEFADWFRKKGAFWHYRVFRAK